MSLNSNDSLPLIDPRFNVLSHMQYTIDLNEKKFTKMCMTEVINADLMIATFGEERYLRTCSEILASGSEAYKQLGLDKILHVYAHTYKHFMVVANDAISDEDFLNLNKISHEQYELSRSTQTDLGGISRFVVVFGENLIDRAKSAYYVHRNSQNNFIIETNERDLLLDERAQDLEIYELLHYAINNDKVVPFYQGIRNNLTGKIDKYESLMRVIDQNGKIYAPGYFLESAKTLKLYISLSKIAIDKALKDFEFQNYQLSLNISLYDIQSSDLSTWLLDRLKRLNDPSKIIVEFVETENYNNNNDLMNFLNEARKIGCKIAVDDFGVGFATYTSIVSLKPAIIKIDGDIIKNLANNYESKIIVESICYMANLISSEVVAEFVENEEIQSLIIENNIHYSQGYHFSKPQPFEQLNLNSN